MAMESEKVQASVVEASEFPDWSSENNVYAVPKVVIRQGDTKVEFEGALPEKHFAEYVRKAVEGTA